MQTYSPRNALVTGSSSGIGLASARFLIQQGMNVALHGLVSEDEGWALARQLEAAGGGKCCFVAGDLSDATQVAAMVAAAREQLGGIDVLVNNGGIQHTATLEEFPLARWQSILDINLTSAFVATQAVLPAMLSNGYGRIINIASVHGLVASANKSAYVAAKHGLVGLTKATALEYANAGITCNAICPGWVDTAIVQKQIADLAARDQVDIEEARKRLVANKQPMHSMTAPESIGAMVAYLCSAAASTITGTAIPIDGGWTAQ